MRTRLSKDFDNRNNKMRKFQQTEIEKAAIESELWSESGADYREITRLEGQDCNAQTGAERT